MFLNGFVGSFPGFLVAHGDLKLLASSSLSSLPCKLGLLTYDLGNLWQQWAQFSLLAFFPTSAALGCGKGVLPLLNGEKTPLLYGHP